MRLLVGLSAAACLVLSSGPVRAGTILMNGSFENVLGTYDDSLHAGFMRLGLGSDAITGWIVGGDGVDWHITSGATAHFGPANDGDFAVDLSLDSPTDGQIWQTFATTAGASYRVSFYLGSPFFDSSIRVSVDGASADFSAEAGPQFSFPWVLETLDFTADDDSATLLFRSLGRGGFWAPVIDDVSVEERSAPVPEPATVLLLGSGLAGLTGYGRRRRTRS